jgi:HEAT repeat protein
MTRRIVLLRACVVGIGAIVLCVPTKGLSQSTESPADRCSWDGWLPPSAGRDRVRRSAHLDAAATANLRARVVNGSKNSRLLAAQDLAAAHDDASIQTLVALTNDSDPMLREAAARSLGRAGATSATAVVERLAASENQHLRQGAVWALGQLQDQSATNTLIVASRDTSKHVRAEATWALGLIGGKPAAGRLTQLALDPNPHVRLAAVCSLERIHDTNDPRTREVLSTLGHDGDAIVRETARWAAARLPPESASQPPRTR